MDQETALTMLRISRRMTELRGLEATMAFLVAESLRLTGATDGYGLVSTDDPPGAVRRFGAAGEPTRLEGGAAILGAGERASQAGGSLVVTRKDPLFGGLGLEAATVLWVPFDSREEVRGGLALGDPQGLRGEDELELFVTFVHLAGGIVRSAAVLGRTAARAQYLADYDDLVTRLPNRLFFRRQVREAVEQAGPRRPVALLFLDLDDFEGINRALGHDMGDAVLLETGQRLRRLLASPQPPPFLARLGGDEFGILLGPAVGEEEATRLASLMVAEFQKPLAVRGHNPIITASIGIALCPVHARSAQDLLLQADRAMYTAKSSGKNAIRLCQASPETSGTGLDPVHPGRSQT